MEIELLTEKCMVGGHMRESVDGLILRHFIEIQRDFNHQMKWLVQQYTHTAIVSYTLVQDLYYFTMQNPELHEMKIPQRNVHQSNVSIDNLSDSTPHTHEPINLLNSFVYAVTFAWNLERISLWYGLVGTAVNQ